MLEHWGLNTPAAGRALTKHLPDYVEPRPLAVLELHTSPMAVEHELLATPAEGQALSRPCLSNGCSPCLLLAEHW